MRRPRPSTFVWRSLDGFLAALLVTESFLLAVVGVEEEEETSKFLDCWAEMEPMKGPLGGARPDPEPGS